MRILALLLLGMLILGCTQPTGNGGNNETGNTTKPTDANGVAVVKIQGFAFSPAETSVKQGGTVVWVNEDSVPHTVTGGTVFSSPTLAKGENYSHTFTEPPGEYDYSCSIHPSMHGKIIVE